METRSRTRLLRRAVITAALGALVVPASAGAATKTPVITKVTPKNVSVGETITIHGKNFRSGKAKNTVLFKRDKWQGPVRQGGPLDEEEDHGRGPEVAREVHGRQERQADRQPLPAARADDEAVQALHDREGLPDDRPGEGQADRRRRDRHGHARPERRQRRRRPQQRLRAGRHQDRPGQGRHATATARPTASSTPRPSTSTTTSTVARRRRCPTRASARTRTRSTRATRTPTTTVTR